MAYRAKANVLWLAFFAAALGIGFDALAAEAGEKEWFPVAPSASPHRPLMDTEDYFRDVDGGALGRHMQTASAPDGADAAAVSAEPQFERAANPADEEPADGPVFPSIGPERAADDPINLQLAQFALDKPAAPGEAPSNLPKRLTYQYAYGSESEAVWRFDPDLNRRVRDDTLVLLPQINGYITYRPSDWLETTLEMILEREVPVIEESVIILPSGDQRFAQKRRFSLAVDQAFFTIKDVISPFEFSLGRRNYEDERHWLYDTSLDIARVDLKLGDFGFAASAGREVLVDLDLLGRETPDRNNTFILYADYRGIEDIKLAAYTVQRDDRMHQEGRPWLSGLRSIGAPTANVSYWAELAYLNGRDEQSRRFEAYAFDVGFTYRILGVPLNPNVTLGYAFATGDRNPDSRTNHEFRQTGLQSNEVKFAGVADFKGYGEAVDPELSNLKILTVGLGFRPDADVSVDFVFHKYWLDEISEELRNSPLTAEMNQYEPSQSRDVGNAIDLVIGVRNLFGVRRLGLDLRTGIFLPGSAFIRNDGEDDDPILKDADTGAAIVAKFWW